jgi:hypothetical protein
MRFSEGTPRRERSPEKTAAMIAQTSRSMEVSDAAGAETNRQQFSMERGFGEAQPANPDDGQK